MRTTASALFGAAAVRIVASQTQAISDFGRNEQGPGRAAKA
jgi:hypothetical protein